MDGLIYNVKKIKNGDEWINFTTYQCNECGCDVLECDEHYIDGRKVLCWECAFRTGRIDSNTFTKWCGVNLANVKAAISPSGNIEITTNKYFSWETPAKQLRNSVEYIDWRTNVFSRDGFKCQICGQVGGELNAHHIKPFAKYVKLRYEISNGITLCKKCHINVHKGVVQLE